jgi:aldose 1-epimerase
MYNVKTKQMAGFPVYILTDKATDSHAYIIPACGNSCFRFTQNMHGQQVEIIESPPNLEILSENVFRYGSPILFPFPNRIRQGKFTYEGKEYSLELQNHHDGAGNWIHGFVCKHPWNVEDYGESEESGAYLRCSFDSTGFPEIGEQFPFPFLITVTYSLKNGILTVDADMKNIGNSNMPMGFGIHPYFRAPLGADSSSADCMIRVPANKYWELVEKLPTGKMLPVEGKYDLRSPRILEGLKFDDVFTGLIFEGNVTRTILDDTKAKIRLIVEADNLFREIVVYTPPRPSICFEPYTCATDAVNLQPKGVDAGLRILKSGETLHGKIRIIPEAY